MPDGKGMSGTAGPTVCRETKTFASFMDPDDPPLLVLGSRGAHAVGVEGAADALRCAILVRTAAPIDVDEQGLGQPALDSIAIAFAPC